MGLKVKEIIVWTLQFIVSSVFLGTILQTIRGFMQGRRDAYTDRWKRDKDVLDFLNAPENNQEPNEMSDDSKHHCGLSYDKKGDFKAFQNKQNKGE